MQAAALQGTRGCRGGEKVMLLGAAKEEVLVWACEQAAGKGAASQGAGKSRGLPAASAGLVQGSAVPRS